MNDIHTCTLYSMSFSIRLIVYKFSIVLYPLLKPAYFLSDTFPNVGLRNTYNQVGKLLWKEFFENTYLKIVIRLNSLRKFVHLTLLFQFLCLYMFLSQHNNLISLLLYFNCYRVVCLIRHSTSHQCFTVLYFVFVLDEYFTP